MIERRGLTLATLERLLIPFHAGLLCRIRQGLATFFRLAMGNAKLFLFQSERCLFHSASRLMVPPLSEFAPDIYGSITTETFKKRFSHLLNTAWLASIAPSAVTGECDNIPEIVTPGAPSQGIVIPP